MPATRSRTSTEQPAEVAAEEVKQVQEEGSEIVPEVAAQPDVVKPVEETAVVPDEPAAVAAEPAAAQPDAAAAVTNGSAEPAAASDTNGAADAAAAGTNGAAVSNGVAAEAADEPAAPVEPVPEVTDGKRKSEVGDGDAVPDSTDVKKQKVAETAAEPVAEEAAAVAAVDATA